MTAKQIKAKIPSPSKLIPLALSTFALLGILWNGSQAWTRVQAQTAQNAKEISEVRQQHDDDFEETKELINSFRDQLQTSNENFIRVDSKLNALLEQR